MNKRLLNVNEAAEYIGTSPGTMYQKVHLNEIPYVKIGRALRFDVNDLDEWIDKLKK